jgi:histidine ammonia-lyase
MNTFEISPKPLSIDDVKNIIEANYKLSLSAISVEKINKCRKFLDEKLKKSDEPIYGINTGFGALYNQSVPKEDLKKLQKNLVMSHACGTGEKVPKEIIRLMLLLKIQGLSYGHSGVRLETVERLIDFYNNDILPVIYTQGSLGASGDLAPLAHLSLPLIGLGEVYYKDKICRASDVNNELGYASIELESKEGLALLNGTQFMSAYALWCYINSEKLCKTADMVSAISLDAFDGRIEPFDKSVHDVRPHAGQSETAKNIREILAGSEIAKKVKKHVQDPYSFRCIPQVHGAARDALRYAKNVIETEINSVTDNPTIFPEEDKIISAGNFHGQPLALVMDFMAIALAELGSISERRIFKLVSGQRELPAFLVANPGLNSGFMIPQYTAASIVSQNKQLCTPASIDSIDSSNGQEDHVSMGANAATKLYRVVNNVQTVLAVELFTAAQALEFRRPLKSSPEIEKLITAYRTQVPFIETDKLMYEDIEKSRKFVTSFSL